jgi:hypothetical protein
VFINGNRIIIPTTTLQQLSTAPVANDMCGLVLPESSPERQSAERSLCDRIRTAMESNSLDFITSNAPRFVPFIETKKKGVHFGQLFYEGLKKKRRRKKKRAFFHSTRPTPAV